MDTKRTFLSNIKAPFSVLKKRQESFPPSSCTSQRRFFLFTKNVDDIVEVVEYIVESVDENVEERDNIDFNGYYVASPINSHLTADPISQEPVNMEDKIAFIKAELLALKSFVTEELYMLFQKI